MIRFTLLFVSLMIHIAIAEVTSSTFHIRHFTGKAISVSKTSIPELFAQHTFRHRFQWRGLILYHVPTSKCIVPINSTDETRMILSDNCSKIDAFFKYDPYEQWLKHLKTGQCVQLNVLTNVIVLGDGCNSTNNKFWLVPNAMYVFRHINKLCWMHDPVFNLIRLQDTPVCDRFVFSHLWHLKHVGTGKCVQLFNGYLRLTGNCMANETRFIRMENFKILSAQTSKCVQTDFAVAKPAKTSALVLADCGSGDQFRFPLYEEKDIFDVHISSDTCNDFAGICSSSTAVIQVNGYDLSLNKYGINLALLDYRSGIMEYQETYNVNAYSSKQVELADYLNNLLSGKMLLLAVRGKVKLSTDLALALQRYGVTPFFAVSDTTDKFFSLAAIVHTGRIRKSWEKVVEKLGGTSGASVITTKVHAFRDFESSDLACDEEMGLRSGRLSDSRFTAKSVYSILDKSYAAYQARLHKEIPGWCCKAASPVSDYLQIDLSTIKVLRGIALQSHGTIKGLTPVASFKIQHSVGGRQWQTYSKNSTDYEFRGCSTKGETVVHWFKTIEARFIRVVPTARAAGTVSHCVRMELFGCSPNGPSVYDKFFHNAEYFVSNVHANTIIFYGTAPGPGPVDVTIQASEAGGFLYGSNLDQFSFSRINASMQYSNGTAAKPPITSKTLGQVTKLPTGAAVRFEPESREYHVYRVIAHGLILDTGKERGLIFGTYVYESTECIRIISERVTIKRSSNGHSNLELNVKTTNQSNDFKYKNGESIWINVSINHLVNGLERSQSNAYNTRLYIYYDTQQLKLTKYGTVKKAPWSLSANQQLNDTGLVYFRTDRFPYHVNQHFSVSFEVNIASYIGKAASLKGGIIIEYIYSTNRKEFNGHSKASPTVMMPYECAMEENLMKRTVSERLSVPYISALYDEVSNNMFFCVKKEHFSQLNKPACYWNDNGGPVWMRIPFVASIVGIDTSDGALFGIDPNGNGYVKLVKGYESFNFVDDITWISIESVPRVRKSVTSFSLTQLPIWPSGRWVLSSSGESKWAITKKGILQKMGADWGHRVQF